MPIDVASYRRWEGRARPSLLATFAIASTMVRRRMRLRIVKVIVGVFALMPSVIAALLFYLSARGEAGITARQIEAMGLTNVDLLAVLNQLFDRVVGFWATLFAALVAAPLIAEDRRARALPLYFSRPIGHVEYVLGKALSAVFFLSLLLILPRISMYVMQISISDEAGIVMKQMPTLLRSCLVGALGMTVLTSIALGVSSMTERPTYAAFVLMAVMAVATGAAAHLQAVGSQWLALSPTQCVQRIGMDLFNVPAQLREDLDYLERLRVARAWTGLGVWTGLSLLVLVLRVRRVEVVT